MNGIQFPRNGDAPTGAFVAIQFQNPQSNGLPIWGPSDAGVTVVRKIKPTAQTAASNGTYYVAQFWWSAQSNFNWDSGSPNTYWGFHPYPPTNTVAAWYWEIAAEAGDAVNNRNASPISVVNDVWYTQAIRVTHNGNGTKTLVFYMNLPSTDNAVVIQFTSASGYGETDPPDPALTIGDSPWYASYQHERFSGIQGPIKIFDKVLSEADMLSEAADMTQLTTVDGAAHIWWGKNDFDTIDDLTCDYGTGRSFAWADTNNKGTLVSIGATPIVRTTTDTLAGGVVRFST